MSSNFGNFKLDARPDRIDLRDRLYQPPLKPLAPEFPPSRYIEDYFPLYKSLILDQGSEGACTGFGLACTINYLLWCQVVLNHRGGEKLTSKDLPAKVSYRMLYHLARFYDEWPGEDYEGSSCRGAVKAWYKHGVCSLEFWPYRDENNKVVFIKPSEGWEEDAATRPLGVYYRIKKESLTDMRSAIQEVGAVYVSAQVHDGWRVESTDGKTPDHDTLPQISWDESSTIQGGHAFALVGYNQYGFIVQNSWGEKWGRLGFAILSYEDWLENGRDAWVCVMGAPTASRVKTHYISSSTNREKFLLRNDPGRFSLFKSKEGEHVYRDPVIKPWDEERAYKHTLVMGNDGKVLNRLLANDGPIDTVNDIILEKAGKWLAGRPNDEKHIVIYAHGGLNSEGDSINRICTMAPYFKENGVYPVYLTWRTGVLESIVSIMGDSVGRFFPKSEGLDDLLERARNELTEVLDRTLEVACEKLGVKAIWSQMKQNAEESAMRADMDRGTYLLLKSLVTLKEQHPDLQIHLVGHSAGSIILGHFLDDCARNRLTVASCTLYAAACTLQFANSQYVRAHHKGILTKDKLAMYVLSEENELDDTVGPYQKSLLYLISRALEKGHKTPILGMAKSFSASSLDDESWNSNMVHEVEKWQEFWAGEDITILDGEQVCTAAEWDGNNIVKELSRIDAAHGSFDNDIRVVAETIARITGAALEHKVENLRY